MESAEKKFNYVYEVARKMNTVKELYCCSRNVDAGLKNDRTVSKMDAVIKALGKELDKLRAIYMNIEKRRKK